MKTTLPRIYPITDTAISGLSHFEQVRRLIEGGANLIQLREKRLGAGEWLEDAANAVQFAKSRGVTILINDRVDMAIALGADGVHLGQNDLPPAAARRILGPDAIIGFSTHSLEQMRLAIRMPVDYFGFGPVFSTKTKPDSDPVVGLELLRRARREASGRPLVAIGGITGQNVHKVIDAGADSAAMITAILSPGHRITENLQTLLNSHR